MPRSVQKFAARKLLIRTGLRRLVAIYGHRTSDFRGTPLDVLVEAFLSQNTNMVNSTRGYRALRRRFPTWTKVMLAPPAEVERQIAICGLAKSRTERLQSILKRLKLERGKLDLAWLQAETPEATRTYLTSFHGIGPKTAAFVQLFALGHAVVPIDNGILRVIRRLRWVKPAARDAEAERVLSPLVPSGRHYEMHVLLFTHAKQRCRPGNPNCDDCTLLPQCPFGQKWIKHLPAADLEPLLLSKRERQRMLAKHASAGLDPVG